MTVGNRDLEQRAELSAGRPARSTGAFQRAEALCGRPGRSTGPPARTGVHVCARRSTDSVDRLQARSTDPVDRQKRDQTNLGIENLVFICQKNPIKFLKFHKNKIFKQLLKHRVYGNDPLHIHGEISMFLTLSSKFGFG